MRRWVMVLAAAAVLASCGTVDEADERPVAPAPTLPGGTVSSETAAPTSDAPTTTVVEQSTTDFPTTTTIATTTTPAGEPVSLLPDGLGSAKFDQDSERVIGYLTAQLGPPSQDSGWVPAASSPYGVCPGNEVRGLRWGPLQALFGDRGTPSRTFFTWVYAVALLPAGEEAGAASGLQTAEGIGLGSSIADLAAAYPQLKVDSDIYGPTFDTGGLARLTGTISSDGLDGFVTSIVGGTYCGE